MGLFDFLKRKSKEAVPQPPKEENHDVEPQDSEVETRDEETDEIEMPQYLKTKVHGQTATLVDMLIELNKRKHFTSPEEAVNTLFEYIERFRTDGDDIAFYCSARILDFCADESFIEGHLDVDLLRHALYRRNHYNYGVEKIYKDYVIDKTIKIVEMMNEFQRYTNSGDVNIDFIHATGGVNHCGPNPDDYYFGFGSPTGSGKNSWIFNKVYSYFQSYVNRYWSEFAPNGTLDNALFRDFMLERHEKAVEKYGIDAVIRMNYHHACGKAVVPNDGWVGPVYVEVDDSRKYIKSCGEGRGPNEFNNYFEMKFLKRIIDQKPSYLFRKEDEIYVNSFIASLDPNVFDDRYDERVFKYSIPISDYSLPIYDMQTGEKQFFDSQNDKAKFIIKMKLSMGESLRCPLPPYLEKEHLKQELMELAESEEERKQIKEEFSWIYWD